MVGMIATQAYAIHADILSFIKSRVSSRAGMSSGLRVLLLSIRALRQLMLDPAAMPTSYSPACCRHCLSYGSRQCEIKSRTFSMVGCCP
jgi:hypothetical protein